MIPCVSVTVDVCRMHSFVSSVARFEIPRLQLS